MGKKDKKIEAWKEYLRPSDWEVVSRAPGNFFLSGEHAVMFGHPAVVQAIPKYFYVGLRRRLNDSRVNVDSKNVYFVDVLDPEEKSTNFIIPTRMIACQLEHLLSVNGWHGVDIGFYSELPSMCGLASSGALAAALSIGLHYLFQKGVDHDEMLGLLNSISNPTRMLDEIIKNPAFSKIVFPLSWCIDTLFHNHQSSGANAFFSLIGSPDGLPSMYKQTEPRKGDVDNLINGFLPSRTISENSICTDYNRSPKSGLKCSSGKACPDYSNEFSYYSNFPYEAKTVGSDFPNASCELFNFGCSLVYSGMPKTTEMAIRSVKERIGKLGEYFSKVKHLMIDASGAFDVTMAYLGSVSEELWQTIGSYFHSPDIYTSNNVVQKIGFAQSGLRNLLGISTEQIDYICRQSQIRGFEAKLTGGGKGGDVVLLCEGKDWNKLREFEKELENLQEASFRSHFHARWLTRDFVCYPSIVKAQSHRFLTAIDIKGSEIHRTKDSMLFDGFSRVTDEVSHAFNGRVLAYHLTDDQRLIAFETEDMSKKHLSVLTERLRDKFGIECYCAVEETPFDWAEITDLEPTTEQSKWVSNVIHKLK